jgi:hypothetical protein
VSVCGGGKTASSHTILCPELTIIEVHQAQLLLAALECVVGLRTAVWGVGLGVWDRGVLGVSALAV